MRIPEISEETRRRIRRVGLFLIAAGVVLYAAQVGREMYANYTEVEKARAAQEKARAEEAAATAKLESEKITSKKGSRGIDATAEDSRGAATSARSVTFYLKNNSRQPIDLWWRNPKGQHQKLTGTTDVPSIMPQGIVEQESYNYRPGTYVIRDLAGNDLWAFSPPTTEGDRVNPMLYPESFTTRPPALAPLNTPPAPRFVMFYIKNNSSQPIDLYWRTSKGQDQRLTGTPQVQSIPPGGVVNQESYLIPGQWVIKDLAGNELGSSPPPITNGDPANPMLYPESFKSGTMAPPSAVAPRLASSPRSTEGINLVVERDKPFLLYWIDFEGREVLYQCQTPTRCDMRTYVGHVWVAKDAATRQPIQTLIPRSSTYVKLN